jgi:hypothetical protein
MPPAAIPITPGGHCARRRDRADIKQPCSELHRLQQDHVFEEGPSGVLYPIVVETGAVHGNLAARNWFNKRPRLTKTWPNNYNPFIVRPLSSSLHHHLCGERERRRRGSATNLIAAPQPSRCIRLSLTKSVSCSIHNLRDTTEQNPCAILPIFLAVVR